MSPSRTLRILCFNIGHQDERYQGQGIAKAMVEYLRQWARQYGWRRIEALSCPDIIPTTVIGDWMLRRGPLERRGFRVVEESAAPPEEVELRLQAINDLAAGKKDHPAWADWYVRNFQRFATDTARKSEYDKNYLMACEL
jgi:GNAT superfamily N-acetyltransferase